MALVIANLKSHKSQADVLAWMDAVAPRVPQGITVAIAPSFPALPTTLPTPLALAVQDLSPFPPGAYTGAVAAENLAGYPVSYAILGHSERRRYFHETVQDVANKVHQALASGITPIVCVTEQTLANQAAAIETEDLAKVMVAFEPEDHIGTGISDSLESILHTLQAVRNSWGAVTYIYGGSVNPQTDPAILQHPDIDGFLVGTASLDAAVFVELLDQIAR